MVSSTLPSTTKSTEAKSTTESTVEAKPRSEATMEGEGAGAEWKPNRGPKPRWKAKARGPNPRWKPNRGPNPRWKAKARGPNPRWKPKPRPNPKPPRPKPTVVKPSPPEFATPRVPPPGRADAVNVELAVAIAAYRAGAVAEAAIAAVKNVQYVLKKRPLVSLIDSFVGQLSQVFMLRVFHVGTSC